MMRSTKLTLAVVAAAAIAGCAKKTDTAIEIQTAPVTRRTIVVSAQANGAIEPVSVVEVKSKASGVVQKMPVDIGSQVRAGDLLVQIDARDVQNQYNQAAANLNSARVSEQVAAAQLKRSRELFKERIITAQENEAATLTYANASSSVVAARTNLDLAKQRLEDATVRAPVAGTIISKTAQLGSVITSATSSASGGTTILTMADLTKVRMRAMVNETDIGNIHPGQLATVTVDAYPNRRFTGTVEKIEPQAVVQQSVTMFAVLISLPNLDAALMPGMNGEATMIVSQRDNVLAVPNDAIRSTRELATVAPLLGLNPDSLRSMMQRQRSGGGGFGGGAGGATGANPRGGAGANVPTQSAGAVPTREGGGAAGGGRGGFGGGFGGDTSQAARAARRAAFARAGGDTSAAGRAARRAQFGGGGFGNASSTPSGGSAPGGFTGATAGAGGAGGAFAGGASTRAVVFIKKGGKWEPKSIRTGVSDFDYTEVLNGLQEGDSVALLASAAMQANRAQQQQRARAATGGGLQNNPTGGATGGAGGGGGGRGPGGG